MTTLSYTLPTVGSPNSTEDPIIRTALSDIKDAINGNLDAGNLAAGSVASSEIAANTIVQGDVATTFITSGTYSPTSTLTTNLDGVTPGTANYSRVGSMVTVFGVVALDATIAGAIEFELTLPVSSDLTTDTLAGTWMGTSEQRGGRVLQGGGTNRAVFNGSLDTATSLTCTYIYGYRVI